MMNRKILVSGLMGALMMFGGSVIGERVLAAENNQNNVTTVATTNSVKQGLIGEEKAANIALQNSTNAKLIKVDLDRSRGILVYEVEVLEGNREKEFKINAQTGEILKVEYDEFRVKVQGTPNISFEQAMEIANKKAETGEFKSIELKEKKGNLIYEIEIKDGHKEKEFKIDAQTGEILSFKVENDRW